MEIKHGMIYQPDPWWYYSTCQSLAIWSRQDRWCSRDLMFPVILSTCCLAADNEQSPSGVSTSYDPSFWKLMLQKIYIYKRITYADDVNFHAKLWNSVASTKITKREHCYFSLFYLPSFLESYILTLERSTLQINSLFNQTFFFDRERHNDRYYNLATKSKLL